MNYQLSQAVSIRAVAIFFLPLIIFSKSLHANQEADHSAKTELQEQLKSLRSFYTEFSQRITDVTGNELQSSSGKLSLQKPNQLRWETILPDETLLIADGTTVWNVDPFVEQVTLMSQERITQSNPLMLLVSDDEAQWQSVSVERIELDKVQDENPKIESFRSEYNVRSLEENANIISLTITFENNQLVSLKSTDRQQQHSLLMFSNSIQNEVLAQDHFIFEVPSNYIIDDQQIQ